MKIECPDCGGTILSPDIDMENGTVKCRRCGLGFPVDPRRWPLPRSEVRKPERFSVSVEGGETVISFPWLGKEGRQILLLSGLAGCFITAMCFVNAASKDLPLSWPEALLAAGAVAAATLFVAAWRSMSEIRISPAGISVKDGDMPLQGVRNFRREEIDRIHCYHTMGLKCDFGPRYYVIVHLRGGGDKALTSDFECEDDIQYIRRTAEKVLGLGPPGPAGGPRPGPLPAPDADAKDPGNE